MLVLKFYRPARWTNAQIDEEHRFTTEMAVAELPVAAPVQLEGRTLFEYESFRFAAFPWMFGRAPELDAPEARQIFGRTLGRMHQIGARRPFQVRPRLGIRTARMGGTQTGVGGGRVIARVPPRAYESVSELLEKVEQAFWTPATCATSASTAIAIWEICSGTSAARCSWTSMTARWGHGCRTCG